MNFFKKKAQTPRNTMRSTGQLPSTPANRRSRSTSPRDDNSSSFQSSTPPHLQPLSLPINTSVPSFEEENTFLQVDQVDDMGFEDLEKLQNEALGLAFKVLSTRKQKHQGLVNQLETEKEERRIEKENLIAKHNEVVEGLAGHVSDLKGHVQQLNCKIEELEKQLQQLKKKMASQKEKAKKKQKTLKDALNEAHAEILAEREQREAVESELSKLKAAEEERKEQEELQREVARGVPLTREVALQRNASIKELAMGRNYLPMDREFLTDEEEEEELGREARGRRNINPEDSEDEEEDDLVTFEDRRVKARVALALVDLWEPFDDEVVCEALGKLIKLAQEERNRKWIRLAGAFPLLLNYVRSATPPTPLNDIQALSVRLLMTLCHNAANRDEVRKHGGLLPLVKLMDLEDDDPDLMNGIYVLKEVIKNKENRVHMRDAKILEKCVANLNTNERTFPPVLDMLYIMCHENIVNQATVREQGGVQKVMTLLDHNKMEIKRRAVRTLGALAGGNRKVQEILHKANIMPKYSTMLTDDDMDLRRISAGGIASIAENDIANQTAALDSGALPHLITMLSSSDEHMKEASTAALRVLAKGNSKIQQFLGDDAGCVPALISNMSCVWDEVKIHSTGALLEIARDHPKNQNIIFQQGVVDKLVAGLRSPNPILQYLCGGAIWALAKDSEQRKIAIRNTEAPALLREIGKSSNEKLKQGALWALEVLE